MTWLNVDGTGRGLL